LTNKLWIADGFGAWGLPGISFSFLLCLTAGSRTPYLIYGQSSHNDSALLMLI
jgi:hypothetical protein